MERNTGTAVVLVGLLLIGCSEKSNSIASPNWTEDFGTFLATLKQSAEPSCARNSGQIAVTELETIFLDKRVFWEGTLKYVHKGRPYFVEAFVPVNGNTKLAAVMYYPDTHQALEWENIKQGAKVKYTGVISEVRVETVASKKPFPFVVLRNVGIVEQIKQAPTARLNGLHGM